jgi:hypothetical protein
MDPVLSQIPKIDVAVSTTLHFKTKELALRRVAEAMKSQLNRAKVSG